MKAIFSAAAVALKDPEVESETRRQWLKGLIESGINSQEQIDAGIKKCRAHPSPFLPSVGQFVSWCKQADEESDGLPTEVQARRAMNSELAKSIDLRNWSAYHPAVYWAYSRNTSFDWKMMKDREQEKEFSFVWTEAKNMIRKGFKFEAVLPAPKKDAAQSASNIAAAKPIAEKAVNNILSMFDEEPVIEREDNTGAARAQLQKAMMLLNRK